MGGNSRQEYLAAIQQRYHQSTREEKGLILQEFCAVCGYHHKHVSDMLKEAAGQRPGPDGVAAIPLWLPFYAVQVRPCRERAYEKLSDEVENQLLSISAATIDRRLVPTRAKTCPRGLGATKPGSLLRNQIPIRTHVKSKPQGFRPT